MDIFLSIQSFFNYWHAQFMSKLDKYLGRSYVFVCTVMKVEEVGQCKVYYSVCSAVTSKYGRASSVLEIPFSARNKYSILHFNELGQILKKENYNVIVLNVD